MALRGGGTCVCGVGDKDAETLFAGTDGIASWECREGGATHRSTFENGFGKLVDDDGDLGLGGTVARVVRGCLDGDGAGAGRVFAGKELDEFSCDVLFDRNRPASRFSTLIACTLPGIAAEVATLAVEAHRWVLGCLCVGQNNSLHDSQRIGV